MEIRPGSHRRGDKPHAHGVSNQTNYIVNLESLHYLAAMTFDGFYTQLESNRDFSRAVALCHHSQHFDLSRSQLVERATQLDGVGDRRGEAAEICFRYQVLGPGADAGYGRVAANGASHEDQRGRGPEAAQQCQRGLSVERPERVIGKDDVRQEISERRSERVLSLDAFGDCGEAGSMQLVLNKLSVGFAVFEHEDTHRFYHGRGNRKHSEHISN